ncbi:TonB-dependent receptor [Paludibacter sp.]
MDASLTGHTVDKLTREHVGFLSVRIKGTTIGTAVDASGHFALRNLPAEELTVVVSGVGYKTVEKNVDLKRNKSAELSIEIEEDAVMLDNVVVSANRNETKKREAANVVNIITPKLFDNTNSFCLSQGLSCQSGLRVENNCQNCGFQQVRINGLEGPYSQILIDSRPIFSALAGVYGIEQIPANMVERVEVVRGGGSALFGSNAVAGTINIITKEPLGNSLTATNSTMFIGGKSADINTNVNAALVSEDFLYGVSIYGSSRQRDSWDANGDGFTEIGLINAKNLGLRSYFKTSNQSKLTIEYHNLNEFRRGGNNLKLPAHQADVTEQTDHNINSGGVKWEYFTPNYKHRFNVFSSAQHIHRNSYYGVGQDPNAYGLTTDLSFVAGTQYAYSFDKLWFMPSDITVGTEYSYNKLVDEQLAYKRQINQEMNIASVFFQNEWKNNKLSLLMGARVDKHNKINNPIFSPRLNIRYNPAEWVNLRASYAEGFRAPQAFDEDLHITAAGGVMQIIVLSPNLKPEQSRSYSISADFYNQIGKAQTNFLIEAFYTDINGVFYLEEAGFDINGNSLLMRKNGAGAIVKGINLEGKVVPTKRFTLQFGFTFQESLYKTPQLWSANPSLQPQRIMFRSPNLYGYMTANYTFNKRFSISMSRIYTGSMLVQHYGEKVEDDREMKTPHFFDLGLKAAYNFYISESTILQLNCGVQNVLDSYQKDFDTGANRDAGYIYGPSLPRSFYAGLKLDI